MQRGEVRWVEFDERRPVVLQSETEKDPNAHSDPSPVSTDGPRRFGPLVPAGALGLQP
jgi:hypothetical protein